MRIKHYKTLISLSWLKKMVALMIFFSIVCGTNKSLSNDKDFQNIVSVSYISGWEKKDGSYQSAIQFKLKPGWKTYWKNPGPFGIKPIITWSNSSNVKNIEITWPTPKIFRQNKARVIGYEELVVIPIKIIKIFPRNSTFLNIDLEFGVCFNICLMKKAKIISPLELEASEENFNLITEAVEKVPSQFTSETAGFYKCAIKNNNKEISVSYSIDLLEKPYSEPAFLIEYAFSEAYPENQTMEIKGKYLAVNASLNRIKEAEGSVERDRLRGLLIHKNKGFEIFGCG